jgi:hypothetical protein
MSDIGAAFCVARDRFTVRKPRRLTPYLSWVEMLLNFEFNAEPRPFTTDMIATEMPAAMRPYSMAVAADSSLAKRESIFFIVNSCVSGLSAPIRWPDSIPVRVDRRNAIGGVLRRG